ncbi:MAG: hypothetical protein RLZ12_242 [Bacillota bacterium]|jgi:phosphoglycolate phosphatase
MKSCLLIFDCDGVLVDSEFVGNQIQAELLTQNGLQFTVESSLRKFLGMSSADMRKCLQEEYNFILTEQLANELAHKTQQALQKQQAALLEPIWTVLKDVPKCIASNSSHEWINKMLELSNQAAVFPSKQIFSAYEVKRGKPYPDLFLYAAKKMGFRRADCLVIEDSIAGIKAAKAAQMEVVGFLGGEHTKFEWYKEQLVAQEIPLVQTALELLQYINKEAIN